MTKLVFLDSRTMPIEMRRPSFVHEWMEYDETSSEQVVERLKDATIAIANKVELRREHFAALPELKMVALTATGYNIVDVVAAKEHGVAVANAPDYSTPSVPEHVMMLVLALRRKLLEYREEVRRGEWTTSNQFCLNHLPILDVHGSNFGIIGYGNLGRAVGRLAEAFGARVLVAERKGAATIREGRKSFDEVLRTSDILTFHVPLTDETRGLIGEAELQSMKRSAVLINTARGGIIDEAALVQALIDNRIAGAGVDVLTVEPPPTAEEGEGNSLLARQLPNLIVTPHNAWSSEASLRKLADQVIDNIEAYMRGEELNRIV